MRRPLLIALGWSVAAVCAGALGYRLAWAPPYHDSPEVRAAAAHVRRLEELEALRRIEVTRPPHVPYHERAGWFASSGFVIEGTR